MGFHNTALIGASNQGYNIARSVRLRSSASGYFSRTPASASNRKTWTWSGWVKRGLFGGSQMLFDEYSASDDNNVFTVYFTSSNALTINGYSSTWRETTQVFRDPAAWYHIVIVLDTTQATAGNRVKLYVNGVEVTSFSITTNPTLNADLGLNQAATHTIGRYVVSSIYHFDGYLTEINFIDGQALTPSSFGETDSITGVWKPKAYSGTYGTNGFELNFSDNSNNTAATIGKDYSGNGNNWTPNNISVTAGVTYDSMVDSPTVGSLSSNYAVLNPLLSINGANTTFSNGNLQIATASGSNSLGVSTIPTSSGKWYFEATQTASGDATFGIWQPFSSTTLFYSSPNNNYRWYGGNGNVYDGAGNVAQSYSTYTNGDVLGIALDLDNGKVYYSKNNVYQGSSNPVTGTNPVASGLTGTWLFGCNTGGTGATFNANFGQRPFAYTPPTGFVALNTYNLPASTITNGAAYMAATLYSGTGGTISPTNTVNSVSFQPDWVWIKVRSTTYNHNLFDSVRGVQNVLNSNATYAENVSGAGDLTAFNSNGFTVRQTANYELSNASATYVGWQWKAGTTSASNINGTITSTVSAGATQGFSVVTYTGTGANATVGHGLGVAPSMVIVKMRSAGGNNWQVYHSALGQNKILQLDLTTSVDTITNYWYNGTTSTVFGVNGSYSGINSNGATYVAYCFSAVAGYSAFGSYTGNGSADGPFIYTGFRPRWVMWKRITTAGGHWGIIDSGRNTYNLANLSLLANSSDGDATNVQVLDLLSNGFKIRTSDGGQNLNADSFIYMAFAENPFKYANAR